MNGICGLTVKEGPQGLGQVSGELPICTGASIPLTPMHVKLEKEQSTFLQKWQEILSTLETSEQQSGTALPVPALEGEKISSAASSNVAVAPQSTGKSDIRHTSLDGSNVLKFGMLAPPGLTRKIPIENAANPGPVARSNPCGDTGGEPRISAKLLHHQIIGGTKASRPRQVRIANVTNPLATFEFVALPVNPLTVAMQSDHPAWTGTTEQRPIHNTPAHVSVPSKVTSSELIAVDELQNSPKGIKADTPAPAFEDSSTSPSPKVEVHPAIQPADAAPFPIEKGLLPENGVEIREEAWHRVISSSSNLAKNPIDDVLAGRAAEGVISESIPRVQESKAIPTHRAYVAMGDGLQTTRTIRDSFSIAAHPVNTSEMKPASISPQGESGAPFYACPVPTQISVARSNESISRFESQNNALNAIDEHVPISRWTLAGIHRAEAGFEDPSLGWVSVRAQAGAGGIHAVVVPASDTAAQVLNTHLAGLNAHITTQYEHLSTVTLASSEPGSANRDAAGQSTQHDHRDSNQKEAQQGREHSQPTQAVTPQRASSSVARMEMGGVEIQASIFANHSGEGHFSVIA